MKRTVAEWSVERLYKERQNITFPEYQRQANLWSAEKKALLIDSILRNIDIPKLYFSRTEDGYEVVDGQQRLWAIWDYLDNNYASAFSGSENRFSTLSPTLQDRIKNYTLQVTVLEDADDAYLRELFIRLQLGLLLITGEKLHAATGRMKDFIFGELSKHQFVEKLGIPRRRFARETLCAQISINSFSRAKLGFFSRTRYEDLQYFFQEYEHPEGKDREFFRTRANQITAVMNELWECFGQEASQLSNRSYVLSVYLFVEESLRQNQKLSRPEEKRIAEFVLLLWKRLKEEAAAGFERRNKELYTFEIMMSSAPGEKYQIDRRHTKLTEYYAYFKKTGTILGD